MSAKLQTSLIRPGCAMGKYTVKAKGFLFAVLRWGDKTGPLPEWSPIAYVPIDPAGNGEFFFPGRRAIPFGVTHIWAECVSYAYQQEIASCAIPEKFLPPEKTDEETIRFSILTDLHLAAKSWTIKRALHAAESDTILLLGDSVNDGLPEQFDNFIGCIEETVPEKTILPVPGNHDIAHPRFIGHEGDGAAAYSAFQKTLLLRAEEKSWRFTYDPGSFAWSTRYGGLDMIGLQCVIRDRKFLFPEGLQLDWLEKHLEDNADADWHLIQCHAPLLKHNPNRNTGNPYLDKNRCLQEILDRFGNVIFLSGHTHVSPNVIRGGGEQDEKTGNIYLDCGSVVATDTGGEEGLMAPDWKDGCITEISIYRDGVEAVMRSIETGTKFPRGCYFWQKYDRYPELCAKADTAKSYESSVQKEGE